MRELVYDSRGKLPRFVVFKDAVVNQREVGEEPYVGDWRPAYIKLHKQWKGGQGNDT
jgi:SH3-like domain-containing protein